MTTRDLPSGAEPVEELVVEYHGEKHTADTVIAVMRGPFHLGKLRRLPADASMSILTGIALIAVGTHGLLAIDAPTIGAGGWALLWIFLLLVGLLFLDRFDCWIREDKVCYFCRSSTGGGGGA